MSFILDALRKSEHERQRQSAPGIADARYRVTRPGQSRWIPVLIAVLVANAALVGYWLLRPDSNPISAATTPVEIPSQSAPPVASSDAESRSLIPALPETVPETRTEQQPAPASTSASKPPPAPPAKPAPAPARESNPVPSMQAAILAGQLEVPPLRMDMHVYSEVAADRFIFVNMSKYREGDRLDEGPVVRSINADGAVLEHNGTRFSLGRN